MSLIPLLFSDWWEDLDRPHRLLDQHFGMSIDEDDILNRLDTSRLDVMPYRPSHRHRRRRHYHPFLKNLMKRGNRSTSVDGDKKFLATLDVQHFSPEEIKVKVVDNNIIVEATHDEREDEHGWISRQFLRKYQLPSHYDIEQVESRLSSDGILTITAPRKEPAKLGPNERLVKVQFTGQPAVTNYEDSEASNAQKDQSQQRQGQQQQQQQQQQQPVLRGRKSTVKAA